MRNGGVISLWVLISFLTNRIPSAVKQLLTNMQTSMGK